MREKVYESWGRFPRAKPVAVLKPSWTCDQIQFDSLAAPVLPFGCGRSYGDVCLNSSGTLIDVTRLDRFLDFDHVTGRIRCEAGVTLEQVLAITIPRGWFLPVTPGTKFVTVGGAIANDVHGKNHHRAGTFGRHVTSFALLRSTSERIICSKESSPELFAATIGGLGLTGLILWAEIQLRRVSGSHFTTARVSFGSLLEFMRLSREWDHEYEYTVAWVDSQARGRQFGRGILLAGNHAETGDRARKRWRPKLRVPVDLPAFVLNGVTTRLFNTLYFRLQSRTVTGRTVHFEPFLYPLDAIAAWNRMYGRRGFLQYQFVVPMTEGIDVVREILGRIVASRQGAFLAVLKQFGDIPSPGLLSFPRRGLTLAVDLPHAGALTLELLHALDAIVLSAGGAVYPGKDARMSSANFKAFFPQWKTFARAIDPMFSSDFWKRVVDDVDSE